MMTISAQAVQEAMLKQEVGTMEVTKLSGLPSKTVSNFVQRDRRARVTTITKLARALQVNPMELLRKESYSREQ
jgi:DNA-binding Xre family transcriptional regulator